MFWGENIPGQEKSKSQGLEVGLTLACSEGLRNPDRLELLGGGSG